MAEDCARCGHPRREHSVSGGWVGLVQAAAEGLLVQEGERPTHTFSNSSEWYMWADDNCDRCTRYASNPMRSCALPDAGLLDMATPRLLARFGWTEQLPKYPGSWAYPARCPFLAARDDRDEGDPPPAPDPDPLQLCLIADPTEAAALIRGGRVRTPAGRREPEGGA